MHDSNDPRGLGYSRIAYGFVAGQLVHAPALVAVCCPTVNSYKGFVTGGIDPTGVARDMSWAPVYMTYGDNNRSAMIRLPLGRDCVENRATDMATNIYWSAAMSLTAGVDAIQRGLDPGEPCNEDLYTLSPKDLAHRGISILPQMLPQALNAFEADPLTEEVFGPGPKQEFLMLKRSEWGKYHAHISEWEWERYSQFF
jgi:glutamine synthetase